MYFPKKCKSLNLYLGKISLLFHFLFELKFCLKSPRQLDPEKSNLSQQLIKVMGGGGGPGSFLHAKLIKKFRNRVAPFNGMKISRLTKILKFEILGLHTYL